MTGATQHNPSLVRLILTVQKNKTKVCEAHTAAGVCTHSLSLGFTTYNHIFIAHFQHEHAISQAVEVAGRSSEATVRVVEGSAAGSTGAARVVVARAVRLLARRRAQRLYSEVVASCCWVVAVMAAPGGNGGDTARLVTEGGGGLAGRRRCPWRA